ncbi:hypothetical protein ACHAW5_004752 [Stephanodiscus triporus]|uniref:Uncharacterized protein n=1 Tax=Stephanodiscus triporus TaxID=2934178 RepID=A0ABD3MNG6_9STRA
MSFSRTNNGGEIWSVDGIRVIVYGRSSITSTSEGLPNEGGTDGCPVVGAFVGLAVAIAVGGTFVGPAVGAADGTADSDLQLPDTKLTRPSREPRSSDAPSVGISSIVGVEVGDDDGISVEQFRSMPYYSHAVSPTYQLSHDDRGADHTTSPPRQCRLSSSDSDDGDYTQAQPQQHFYLARAPRQALCQTLRRSGAAACSADAPRMRWRWWRPCETELCICVGDPSSSSTNGGRNWHHRDEDDDVRPRRTMMVTTTTTTTTTTMTTTSARAAAADDDVVAVVADARSGPPSSSSSLSSSSSPRDLVREGMRSFRDLDVESSMYYFDAAISASSGGLAPYLWQRGISCYYLNRYSDGHEQFRLDVAANPNDVEEIAWDIACLSRMTTMNDEYEYDDDDDDDGVVGGGGGVGRGREKESPFPPGGTMALPPGRSDPRKIMSKVYSLFRGEDGATEWDLRRAGHDAGSARDEFYSLFYLGLYCEIRNEPSKRSVYGVGGVGAYATGVGSRDYMSSCAKVHCKPIGKIIDAA